MLLLLFNTVSVPHVSARASVVPPDAFRNYPTLLSASFLGLRTISRLLLTLRHGPCNPIICVAHMILAGQQSCPQRLSSRFLVHIWQSTHPVSQQIYSCWSLRPSYLVGSKRALEHNIALPSASGSVAAAPPVIEIM